MDTLSDYIFTQNNDYGFWPQDVSTFVPQQLPTLSVIVSYRDTGSILHNTLHHLSDALHCVRASYPSWQHEVLLLDDGSTQRPASAYISGLDSCNIRLITSATNQGRARTRNEGLIRAAHQRCLFLDSDISVDHSLLLRCLSLDVLNARHNAHPCVIVAFFENRWSHEPAVPASPLTSRDVHINDFRISCCYQPDWIGCDADKAFINRGFRPVDDTDSFRAWKGRYGPWLLPNMVLGGCFLVDRVASLAVNGFDNMFANYGFTETSLPAKLVAKQHFVIPQVLGGAIHHLNNPSHHQQAERNRFFRAAHSLFSEHYITMKLDEALCRPLEAWKT